MVVIIFGNVLEMITMSGKFEFHANLQAKYWKNLVSLVCLLWRHYIIEFQHYLSLNIKSVKYSN